MTIQLKLYEEWIDIMDDYATVFCHDRERGIPSLMDGNDNNSLVWYPPATSSLLSYLLVRSMLVEVLHFIIVFNLHVQRFQILSLMSSITLLGIGLNYLKDLVLVPHGIFFGHGVDQKFIQKVYLYFKE
jgi:hypothetical protein